MNIIKHLTTKITPQVITTNVTNGETALLEKFYSIVLVRLSHEESYKKLLSISKKRKGKKSSQVTYADFVYKLDWIQPKSTEKSKSNKNSIVSKLAENHDVVVSDVKLMFRTAMPLVVQELQILAKDQPVPIFIQELLVSNIENKDTVLPVIDYVPQWGISMFPENTIHETLVSSNVITQVKSINGADTENTISDTKTYSSSDEEKTDNTQDIVESTEQANEADSVIHNTTDSESETDNTDKHTAVVKDEKIEEQKELDTDTTDTSNRKEQNNHKKQLPEPVHVKAPEPVSIEKLSTDTVSTSTSSTYTSPHTADKDATISTKSTSTNTDNTNDLKKLLPIVGVVVLGVLFWGLLKGCNQTKETSPQAMIDNDTTVIAVKNHDDYMPAVLRVEVGDEGALKATKMVSGSQKLDNQVKSALIDTFGNVSENSEFSINESMLDEMPVSKRLNDLLILIKGVPYSSMIVIGNDISFIAPDATSQEKLVSSAQALLPSFKVSSEVSKATLVALENNVNDSVQNDNDKNIVADNNTNDVVAIDSLETKSTDNTPETVTLQPIESEPAVLDIEAEIAQSIKASNEALDILARQDSFTPDELSKALNLQIINFASNQSAIPEVNQKLLKKAAKILLRLPHSRMRIIGHTDSAGDEEYNQRLSNDRAYVIKKFFMKEGMKSIHMREVGMGEVKPLTSNDTDTGRFRNRRIEFIVKQSTPEPTDVAS